MKKIIAIAVVMIMFVSSFVGGYYHGKNIVKEEEPKTYEYTIVKGYDQYGNYCVVRIPE